MIWERLIKWKEETIDLLNKELTEYQEPGMGRFNNDELGWVNRTWSNKYIRRAHVDVVDVSPSGFALKSATGDYNAINQRYIYYAHA